MLTVKKLIAARLREGIAALGAPKVPSENDLALMLE